VSPTVLQSGPYRFFFFSSDHAEPPHVHVARERRLAKLWLEPVRVAVNLGFGQREMARITVIAEKHEGELVRAWHEYFGGGNGGSQTRPRH
jgi:hypothetical protein